MIFGGIRWYVAGVLNKGRNGIGNEHGDAFSDAEELMAKGGPESEERECQKLISIFAGLSDGISQS